MREHSFSLSAGSRRSLTEFTVAVREVTPHSMRMVFVLAVAFSLALLLAACGGDDGSTKLEFTMGELSGEGLSFGQPTSLAFGPDGRLYVAELDGTILALTLDDDGRGVAAVEQISSDATFDSVLGIAFDPFAPPSPLIIYVSSGVPYQDPQGDPYPGKVWRLAAPDFAPELIISGLPTSTFEHATNGIAFGPDGRLYIQQGSTTNAGVAEEDQFAETPLSGATLVADVHATDFDGRVEYSEPGVAGDTVDVIRGDVSVYATGLRNSYDLVFHSNGRLYATDNGPNLMAGAISTGCTTEAPEADTRLDEINVIEEGGYYGHPNRNRGRFAADECVYVAADDTAGAAIGPLARPGSSTNGIAEYTSDRCGLRGDLLYVRWDAFAGIDAVGRISLSGDGASVVADTPIYRGDLLVPLDVTVGPSGIIYVAELDERISYFEPECGG